MTTANTDRRTRASKPPWVGTLRTATFVAAIACLPAHAASTDETRDAARPGPVHVGDAAGSEALPEDREDGTSPSPPVPPQPASSGSSRAAASPDALPTSTLDLSPATLRQAIADAKDPLDDVTMARGGGAFGTGKLTGQARIDQSFQDADIPTCMTPEAFKFDPPHFGPIYFGGFLAAPFLFHAIVTGKCRH